jgi:CHAT domain-containing protein
MSLQQLALQRKLAMLDFEDGHYLDAEGSLTALVGALRDSAGGYELGRALLDRATARRFLNRWDDACLDLDDCERLAASLPDLAAASLLTNVYSMRAQLHLTEQWPNHDLSAASAALDALATSGTTGWWVREAQANLAFRTRDWPQAATHYAEVATAVEREGWSGGAAACQLRAGTALVELGRVEEAGPLVRRAAAFFAELGPSDLRADAERQLARLLVLEARPDDAWEHMLTALSLVETSLRSFRSLFDQQRYLADKDAYYQHAFAVALAAGGADGELRALSVAERAKSFYLCHLVANADVPLFDGVDPAEVERLRALEDRLDELESQIPFLSDAVEARIELESERDAVATEREELLGRVMRDHPRWASAQVPLPFDAARDLAALPETWCALSAFWFGARELHLFLARPGEPLLHHSDRWSVEELRDLQTSQRELRSATTGQLYTHPVIPASVVARVLPREILDALRPDDALLVSPHGALRGVPLHMLAGPRHAVQYIPSLTLLSLARPGQGASDVLLLGCERDGFDNPPLPGVPRELEAVAEAWSRPPVTPTRRVVLDADERLGSGAPAPEELGPYRVILLACHGRLDPERPLEGALLLGRSALRMSELFALRLDADLVCLSACDLGRLGERVGGALQAGDEWLGFTMPLLYAGARSILVSLWKAHDGTAASLMPALHAALHDGRAAADALRDALAAVAEAPEGFWCNWYLVGFPPART